MKTNYKLIVITGLCGLTLSACATTQPALQAHSASFGQATANNTAVHALAATPEQKANTYIPADRERRELARERYKKDEVKEPRSLRTTF